VAGRGADVLAVDPAPRTWDDPRHILHRRASGGRRDDLPVVRQFGGGNLAVSFWTGHNNHAGCLGEIIAYDRHLTDAEVEAIEEDLAQRYGTSNRPRWR
jgi:hypothetical protein